MILFPVFAADVAAGRAHIDDVFDDKDAAIFLLRRVRDFDRSWFDCVYQYCFALEPVEVNLLEEGHA